MHTPNILWLIIWLKRKEQKRKLQRVLDLRLLNVEIVHDALDRLLPVAELHIDKQRSRINLHFSSYSVFHVGAHPQLTAVYAVHFRSEDAVRVLLDGIPVSVCSSKYIPHSWQKKALSDE